MAIFAASVPNFRPDPVGEKLYRAHVYHQALFLAAILAFALLAAWLVHWKSRKAPQPDPTNQFGWTGWDI